ncbi:hypothetical protein N2152v2_000080 [Parachlorella kessleri]
MDVRSAPTVVEDDSGRVCPAAEALMTEILELNFKLSQDDAPGMLHLAEDCARLLAQLPPWLGLDAEQEEWESIRAEALPSFIWLGLIRFGIPPAGSGISPSRLLWAPLRVLGRLVAAATAQEDLRSAVGFPAVWCGVDLIKNVHALRPEWMPGPNALQEFTDSLAVDNHPSAPTHDVEGAHCQASRHAWRSCLLSAQAELAVHGPSTITKNRNVSVARRVPKAVVAAFEAAVEAAETCCESRTRVELLFLISTARLSSLTPDLASRVAAPAGELCQMLAKINREDFMHCHIRVVQCLQIFLFPTVSGYPGQDTRRGPDLLGKLCDSLGRALGSLRLFLELNMQLDTFLHKGGIQALMGLFEVWALEYGRLGYMQHLVQESMLTAAECLVAVLGSQHQEEAQDEFLAASGIQIFLSVVELLPLRLVVKAAFVSGKHELWQLQCASLRVLELACEKCSASRELFIAEGGIAAVIQAMRWYADTPGSSTTPLVVVEAEAQTPLQRQRLADVLCSLVTHACAAVVRVCIDELNDPSHGSDSLCLHALLKATSVEEMEQFLSLQSAGRAEHADIAEASFMDKIAPDFPLPVSVIVCSHMLLTEQPQHQVLFMQQRYPLLYQTHLQLISSSEDGGNHQALAKSLAFATLAILMRERTDWRRQLLTDKVHVAAGAALTAALTTLRLETLAGRKARLHRLQARSRCGAGGGSKCGCGQPGCRDARIGWGDGEADAEGARDGAERAGRINKATMMIVRTTNLLAVLREGQDSGAAVLEVLNDGGKLAAAAAALEGPSMASISAAVKTSHASLKDFLAWGKQQQQQQQPQTPTGEQASKQQAEAAAALLLAEEETEQRKTSAKAGKRQRQKAAKQQPRLLRDQTGLGSRDVLALPAGSKQALPTTLPALAAILGPTVASGPEHQSTIVAPPLTSRNPEAAAARHVTPVIEPSLSEAKSPEAEAAAVPARGEAAAQAERSQAESLAEASETPAVDMQELDIQASASGAPAPVDKHCGCCGSTPGPGVKLKLCSGCRRVRFWGQLLDTTTDDGSALADRKSLAVLLEGLSRKLCQDSPEGAAAHATECAGLLPWLEKHLEKGADLMSSFILQGVTRLSEEGHDWSACIRSALRVLGRLVRAAGANPELRAEVGRPAVWCGVKLIGRMRSQAPESPPDVESLSDFTLPIHEATRAWMPPSSYCEPAKAGHAWLWHTCLVVARAKLAFEPLARTQLPAALPALLAAFQVLRDGEDACCAASVEVELPFLVDAARLFVFVAQIVSEELLPKRQIKELLGKLDTHEAGRSNIFYAQQLLRFAFVRGPAGADTVGQEGEASDGGALGGKGKENDQVEDDDASTSCEVLEPLPADAIPFAKAHQAEALAALWGLLRSLRLFLSGGMHVWLLAQEPGVGVLVTLFDYYYDVQHSFGALEESVHGCLLAAADCLLVLLESSYGMAAQEAFATTCGYERLLDVVDSLWLNRMAKDYVNSGRTDVWQLQCACLSVLEAAVLASEEGAANFNEEQGMESVMDAIRWDTDEPLSDILGGAEVPGTPGAIDEMVRAVVTHALSLVAQACLSCPEGGQLADVTSLEELNQYLRLFPLKTGSHEHARQDRLQSKYKTWHTLSAGLMLCTSVVLKDPRQREAHTHAFPQLRSLLLSVVKAPAGPESTFVQKAAAFQSLSLLLKDEPAGWEQLLTERVHLAARTALLSALALLNKDKLASMRYQICKMRGAFTACTCDSPGCIMRPRGGCTGHTLEALELGRESSMGESASQVAGAATLLLDLKQAGQAGRAAMREVVRDGKLQEAADAAGPAFISLDAKLDHASVQLRDLIDWGQELIQDKDDEKLSRLLAEQAAEAAAAALLAEEEAAQRKAAAKAAKRQRQKAARQQAKQQAAQQAGRCGAEAQLVVQQGACPAAAVGPREAGGESRSPLVESTLAAALSLGSPGAASNVVQAPLVGTSTPEPQASGSREASELSVQGKAKRLDSGQQRMRQPLQPALQPTQQVPDGQTAGQAVKPTKALAKTKKKKKRGPSGTGQQAAERPTPSVMEQQPRAVPILPTVPAPLAGDEQAWQASIPTLGPATPSVPEAASTAAILKPAADLPGPATGRTAPAGSPTLTALLAVPAGEATVEAAPAAQTCLRELAIPATDNPAADYEPLLEFLLPGIVLSQPSLPAMAPDESDSLPAKDGLDMLPGTISVQSRGEALVLQRGPAVPAPALQAVLVCHLTGQQLVDPVIAADGYTYERGPLLAWLQQGDSLSHAMGKPLSTEAVRSNFAVRELLKGFCS